MISVQEMMTAKPFTLSQYDSLNDARKLMEEKRIRHIPIVDEEKLVGLITERDILAQGISKQRSVSSEELTNIESGILLADIMTTHVISVHSNLAIANAAHLIYTKKIGCLPVINYKNKLLGIITDHDFVAITIQLLDVMAEEEPLDDGFA